MISNSQVAVIISHYLSDILSECLESVEAAHRGDLPEVIVVDDRPWNDGSIERARERFPFVRIVSGNGGRGYGAAANRGMEATDKEYVVILNNDVRVTPDWLRPLVATLENDPRVAACFPKVLQQGDPGLFDPAGAGGGLDVLGYPYSFGQVYGRRETDCGQYDEPRSVFWGFGGAMVARRSALLEVGGFDPSFFMQMEEVDLCWRLQLRGYHLEAVPQSRVFHRGGWTRQIARYDKASLDHQNSLRMLLKNYSAFVLIGVLPIRLALEFGAFLFGGRAIRQPRYGRSVAKGWWGTVRTLPATLRARRQAQRSRLVSDWYLLQRMCPVPAPIARFLFGLSTASQLETVREKAWSLVRHRADVAAPSPAAYPEKHVRSGELLAPGGFVLKTVENPVYRLSKNSSPPPLAGSVGGG